jgi:hypothetical protein|tara:strand:- start:53 stop:295 length:243 start_codon:yes stop_codon:yes gene_type:complete
MTEEITNEPVLELNDKKYIINDMKDVEKAFVMELNAIGQEENQLRRQLDRLTLAKEGYTVRLQQSLENPDEGSENEKPAN